MKGGGHMALINCPECSKEISDKAVCCPGCGFPIKEFLSQLSTQETEKSESGTIPLVLHFDIEDNIDLECGKNKHIKIENGIMTISVPLNASITDNLENFTLEYFSISMGINIGLLITNKEKRFSSGILDIVASKQKISDFQRFKSIMEKHGLYSGRSRFSVLYKQTTEEKEINADQLEKIKNTIKTPVRNKNTEKVVGQKTASQDTYKKGGLFTKIKCPRCYSIEFEVVDTKKKFSLGKALVGNTVGGLALGPAGAIAGTFQGVNGKNGKTKFICLHCGKVWEQKI